MKEILQLLYINLRTTQVYQETYTNSNRIPYPTYKAGDKIWLDTCNIMLARPIKKLNTKYYSLFEVDKVLDFYSYKLKLLHELEKIHNIFYPSFLCPTNQLSLPGQVNLLPPPITINENGKKL
jgi:hypothetical protein